MGWKRIKLLIPAPYMEYKRYSPASTGRADPQSAGVGEEARQPAPSAVVRWEGLEWELAQLDSPGLLVKLPTR